MAQLTKNAIHLLRTLPKKEGTIYTVQIIDIKMIGSSKYRAIISDGEFFDQSFIGGASYHFFSNNIVENYQVIRIKDYSVSEINNGFILTLQDIEPQTRQKAMIGKPQKYEPALVKREVEVRDKRMAYSENKENNEMICVKSLTSSSKDFVIKARVTKKSELREWKNERGTGKIFSINIIDSYNEEISINFFKEEAEKFFSLLETGKVYLFKNGSVKISNKKFQTIDSEYSICADKRTEITKLQDESEISTIKFNPVLIESIPILQPNSFVDICAGIIEIDSQVEIISKKTGNPVLKRVLKVLDQSNSSIELTLWGEDARHPSLNHPSLPLIMVGKSLKITNFNGISLSSDRSSQILYSPDTQQTKVLKAWLARNANSASMKFLSVRGSMPSEKPFKSFAEIKQESEASDKEESYTVSGKVGFIRNEPEQMFYTACRNVRKCKKKVVRDASGMFRCESCGENFENCEYRFILSVRMQDYSDSLWVTAFDDVGQSILGVSAGELQRLYIDSPEQFEERMQSAFMKRVEGIVKVKFSDMAQGKKPKYVLSSVFEFDAAKSLKRNLQIIEELISG